MHLLLLAQQFPQIPGFKFPTIPPGVQFAYYAFVIATFVAGWKVFEKAGKPGWASLIPIYNVIVLLEIVGKPLWWILPLILCPCINLILAILICVSLAKSFGQGAGFAIGLFLLPPIFTLILGFGDYRYVGPAG